mmetsp:Transcript_797/g.1905  ORF Transcript_797/g.1905 Transcript_797/m.1905 type:complete len:209 (-) Transcript_797:548-1174(-)
MIATSLPTSLPTPPKMTTGKASRKRRCRRRRGNPSPTTKAMMISVRRTTWVGTPEEIAPSITNATTDRRARFASATMGPGSIDDPRSASTLRWSTPSAWDREWRNPNRRCVRRDTMDGKRMRRARSISNARMAVREWLGCACWGSSSIEFGEIAWTSSRSMTFVMVRPCLRVKMANCNRNNYHSNNHRETAIAKRSHCRATKVTPVTS